MYLFTFLIKTASHDKCVFIKWGNPLYVSGPSVCLSIFVCSEALRHDKVSK